MSRKSTLSGAVVNPAPESITIRSSQYYYRALATELKEGSRIFVPDMGRRQAYYARKKFEELAGQEVLGYPTQVSGKDGYLFHIRKLKKA